MYFRIFGSKLFQQIGKLHTKTMQFNVRRLEAIKQIVKTLAVGFQMLLISPA